MVALEDVPDGAHVENIAVAWAAEAAIGGEEFLVAFKIAPTMFKVVHRYLGGQEEMVFDTTGDEDV